MILESARGRGSQIVIGSKSKKDWLMTGATLRQNDLTAAYAGVPWSWLCRLVIVGPVASQVSGRALLSRMAAMSVWLARMMLLLLPNGALAESLDRCPNTLWADTGCYDVVLGSEYEFRSSVAQVCV